MFCNRKTDSEQRRNQGIKRILLYSEDYGSHKGEKITVSNEYTSSQIQTKKYHKGDTVLLSGSKESPGKTIRSIKRDGYLALLAGGLFFLLI